MMDHNRGQSATLHILRFIEMSSWLQFQCHEYTVNPYPADLTNVIFNPSSIKASFYVPKNIINFSYN